MRRIRFLIPTLVLLVLALMAVASASAVTGVIDKDTVVSDLVSATTSNGLLTVNASPRPFRNSGLNIGISGGANDASVDTYTNEVEYLDWVFTNTVGFLSFKTAWTDGHVILEGFTADPQAYVITDPGISTTPITIDAYDAVSNRVVVNHPWQDLNIAEIGFSNVAASAGQTIRVYVDDTGIDTIWPQIGINELAYTDPVTQTPVYIAGTDLTADLTAVTDDGLVHMTASPRTFSSWAGGGFGIAGGANDLAVDNTIDTGTNAVPDEMIVFDFDASVGPASFKTIWSRGLIVLEGFTEDPGLYVINSDTITNITIYPYDAVSNRASLYHPWQGGAITEIGFSNIAAGAGQSIRFWTFDPAEPLPQILLNELFYATPPLVLSITAAELAAGPEFSISWNSETGQVFAVEGSTDLTNQWSAIETNIAATPPTNTYAVGTTPSRRYVRVAREVPTGVLFSDDLEAGDTTNQWTRSPPSGGLEWEWGTPSPLTPPPVGPANANSGSNCYGTDLDGPYGTNQDPTLKSPTIDLTGVASATLSFYHFQDIEESESGSGTPYQFDYGFVNVLLASDSSLIETNVLTEGTSTNWSLVEAALPIGAMGQEIILEFGFHADGFQSPLQGGWYIDDIEVSAP